MWIKVNSKLHKEDLMPLLAGAKDLKAISGLSGKPRLFLEVLGFTAE